MSNEGRALVMRAHPRSRMPSSTMFDVLATLASDMRRAAAGKDILLSDWEQWLKKSEQSRIAFIRVVFLLVAVGGLTSKEIDALRHELANVTPNRRRMPQILHGPRPRTARGLF